jgi:hypothetical protein
MIASARFRSITFSPERGIFEPEDGQTGISTGCNVPSGDRVKPSGTKRPASKQALECQPRTPENTVQQYGLSGVFGTGGIKSARRRKYGRNENLIRPDQPNEGVSSRVENPFSKNRSSSSRSWLVSNFVAPCRAMNTISMSGGILSRFSLKYSLSLLLIRFLSQAFPLFLPAVIPSLCVPCGFSRIRMAK